MTTRTTSMQQTQAEHWADSHGYTDGSVWHGTDGMHLYDAVRNAVGVHVEVPHEDAWYAEWPDGSVIYAVGSLWDTASSREDATTRCAYCGADVDALAGVPAMDDDDAWREMAGRHADGCEWVETRAHRLD